MRVGVVTDAMTAGNYFPIWYSYYSAQFGEDSIYVFTYPHGRHEFQDLRLGGLHVIPGEYDDDVRKDAISSFVADLLEDYDVVIRVDADEILAVDPLKHASLAGYLEDWHGSHITAFGFDVIQGPEEDRLDLTRPVLRQRRFAYALMALNKTCVTRVPIRWGRGFHYCSLPPSFGDIILFHLKRADIDLQLDWNRFMCKAASNDAFSQSYYSWGRDMIIDYHRTRFELPCIQGPHNLDRSAFNRRFLSSIRYNKDTSLFEGKYEIEEVNLVIPGRLKEAF